MNPSLTFTPDEDALTTLASAWGWLLRAPFEPLLFTALGDVFLRDDLGEVFWLNTGTGELTRVAQSEADFAQRLSSEEGVYWLMPELVKGLEAAGKALRPGWCYTFVVPPIFKEGSYEIDNLNPVPAVEHFGLLGALHAQLQDLPNGAEIAVQVAP